MGVIDQLKGEYGVRSRGQVLEILLEDLLGDGVGDEDIESGEPDAFTRSRTNLLSRAAWS